MWRRSGAFQRARGHVQTTWTVLVMSVSHRQVARVTPPAARPQESTWKCLYINGFCEPASGTRGSIPSEPTLLATRCPRRERGAERLTCRVVFSPIVVSRVRSNMRRGAQSANRGTKAPALLTVQPCPPPLSPVLKHESQRAQATAKVSENEAAKRVVPEEVPDWIAIPVAECVDRIEEIERLPRTRGRLIPFNEPSQAARHARSREGRRHGLSELARSPFHEARNVLDAERVGEDAS